MSNLKVAVRVRPMSDRELQTHSVPAVSVENATISVTNIKVPKHHAGDSRQRVRKYTFDYCFHELSTQNEIFSMVEEEISKSLSLRYNVCVLAYGQSSTGKTYTMMGLKNEPGLTPKLCENIFKYFRSSVTEEEIKHTYTSISYLEIYNERVQDLLTSGCSGKSLRVREHPKRGPYVQGLSEHLVDNSEQLFSWLSIGNGNRQVAATSNNRCSSRSHSVFTISCYQGTYPSANCNRLHLVDLAGSERVHSASSLSHNTPRFKEGSNINRSLVALGNVICALSDQSWKHRKNSRQRFVPYRDSVLTWLLKDTLGGNSKTVMIATISPSSSCYSETVNTLRFGQRAKQIVNQPVVNEDPKEKLIRELRAEIIRLRELLHIQNDVNSSLSNQQIMDNMSDSLLSPKDVDEVDSDCQIKSTDSTEQTEESDATEDKFEVKKIEKDVNLEVKQELGTKSHGTIHVQTETLIPVIDITSTVVPKHPRLARLSRTYSVDSPTLINEKLKKDFGSHETLPDSEATKLISKNGRVLTKVSTENLSKISTRMENSSRSGSISESSGKSTPKQAIKTHKIQRRSEIVAAVTQRLYSQKLKRKDVPKTTEEKGIVTDPFILPRQNICSNARIRLQELTQRALRASKQKINCETQTQDSSTVRVKEKSTDVQDMEIAMLEVKDAIVDATASVQNVGISCHVQNYNQTLKLTRTCAAQTEELPKTQSVSFTKYLQNPLTIHSCTQPIYTSSVNINVSHNYPTCKDDISDDSLEDCSHQNVKYSTPDLISNHNSLEHQKSTTKSLETVTFNTNEFFATDCPTHCIAKQSIVPRGDENIADIIIPFVFAAEVRKINNEFVETCSVFSEKGKSKDFVKPIVKYQSCHPRFQKFKIYSESDTDSSVSCNKNVRLSPQPDSPPSFNKNTHLSPKPKQKDEFDILQRFMKETSTLMCKLNSAVDQVERNTPKKKSFSQTGDLETKDCYVQTYQTLHDASSQTSTPQLSSSSSIPSTSYLLENRWEHLVKTSCDKLEQCVKFVEHKTREHERVKLFNNSESLYKFPQPFSSDSEWKYSPNDFSSLETTHSASDYGSLPRRKSPYRNFSPKAYMKQLVTLRKQVVQSSRDDVMQ